MSEHYLDEIAREHDAACEAEMAGLYDDMECDDEYGHDCPYCGERMSVITRVSNMCDGCLDELRAEDA